MADMCTIRIRDKESTEIIIKMSKQTQKTTKILQALLKGLSLAQVDSLAKVEAIQKELAHPFLPSKLFFFQESE